MKKFTLIAVAALLLLATTPAFSKKNFKKETDLIAEAATLVQGTYVQPVQDQGLYQGAMTGMMKTLDPYSLYLTPEAYRDLQSDTQGKFAGIGLEVSVKGGILHVIAPLAGSSAEKSGILPQDMISKIDGTPTKDMTLTDAVKRLRGEPGSTVELILVRDQENAPIRVRVEREIVKVEGIREAKVLDGGVAYIRVAEFQKKTPTDFKNALARLTAQGPKMLLIDLRNNPGGLLEAAVKVAENFIPKGQLILSTRGRIAQKNREYVSKNETPFKACPVFLLVNRGSASGSEILAGALQDLSLAKVLGKRTYGKGCVQTLTGLSDGSAVRITTSYYYTPKGRVIHEVGVTPDVDVPEDAKDPQDPMLRRTLEILASGQSHE